MAQLDGYIIRIVDVHFILIKYFLLVLLILEKYVFYLY